MRQHFPRLANSGTDLSSFGDNHFRRFKIMTCDFNSQWSCLRNGLRLIDANIVDVYPACLIDFKAQVNQ